MHPTSLSLDKCPLDSSKLTFFQSTTLRPVPDPGSAELWAQNACCDHMITCRWTTEKGWETPCLKPFGDLTISPIASCLHYATQCFEDMKVYRGYDGQMRLFRPELNAKRLAISATRVALPNFDHEELVKLIIALVRVDGPRWLPKDQPGRFLYVRPAMIGDGGQVGVQLPQMATLFIVAIPWPDFSIERRPGSVPRPPGLRLLASPNESTRAWPGGFGYAKVGANYGTTFEEHGKALQKGFDQILWLFGSDCRVTEAGASNFFVVIKDAKTGREELLTATLADKLILDGVTRRSVLELARLRLADQLAVVERDITMFELEKAWQEGRLLEAFVSGTAFFITPVSVINFQGRDLEISRSQDDKRKRYFDVLKDWLKDIMYGVEHHEWALVIKEGS